MGICSLPHLLLCKKPTLHWQWGNSHVSNSLPQSFHPHPRNPATLWKDWKFSFINYLATKDSDKFSDQRWQALLLHCIGWEAQSIFKNLHTTPKLEDETKYKCTLRQLAGLYKPKLNVITEQYTFHKRNWSPSESTAECMAMLCCLAAKWQFSSLTNEPIWDEVVEYTPHPHLQERFLQDHKLTLEAVLSQAKAYETSQWQATMVNGSSP